MTSTLTQHSRLETNDMARGSSLSPSAYHSLLFNLDVNSGKYKKENVSCICGSEDYKQITTKDRYGIDYALCLCLNCGILYSNPRLTEESFKKFYETDYRKIYSDTGEISDNGDNIKELICGILEDFELPMPKIIFEVGCGNGNNLADFKDAECIGVDYDCGAVEQGKAKGLDLRVGGLEVLENLGKKADLIILNHVLEHFSDVERDLKRIRDLLTEEGVLYIAVPSLYVWNKNSLFQNAHNYQFTGNTLCYLMAVCGFSDYYLTEEIKSLWHKSDYASKDKRNPDEYKYVESFLLQEDNKFMMPQVRLACKFGLKERRKNIKHTANSGVPEISELINSQPDTDAIIISGGSSINGYAKKVKELQAKGAKVYSIERMYQWCLKNDIVPDYIVVLDASDDVIESFATLHKDTTHLVVSQVKSEIIDTLKGYKTFYFNLMQKGIDWSKIYDAQQLKSVTFINSGASVSICCMTIAMAFGAKNLHVFGFDCHVTEKNYADGITGVGDIKETMTVEVGGRIFKTTTPYYAFMQQFFQLYQTGKDTKMLDSIKIYGDSMAKAAANIDIDGDKEA